MKKLILISAMLIGACAANAFTLVTRTSSGQITEYASSDINRMELTAEGGCVLHLASGGTVGIAPEDFHSIGFDANGGMPEIPGLPNVPSEPEKVTVVIYDGEEYVGESDMVCDVITYVRNFRNTNWQPLYVPFAMEHSQWAAYADVAELAGVHMYDDDNDGTADRTSIEFLTVKEGTLKPNVPYVIRAKATGETSIVCENTTLCAAPEAGGQVSCSSPRWLYTMRGTYKAISDLDYANIYIMSAGKFQHTQGSLGAYRFYLEVTKRSGGYWEAAPELNPYPETIDIYVDGEPCSIEGINADIESEGAIYDLSGRRIENPSAGFYIVGGKKVFVK